MIILHLFALECFILGPFCLCQQRDKHLYMLIFFRAPARHSVSTPHYVRALCCVRTILYRAPRQNIGNCGRL